jgi:hypothetical protein
MGDIFRPMLILLFKTDQERWSANPSARGLLNLPLNSEYSTCAQARRNLNHWNSKKKITALGVMFEFTGGNANTTVQKVGAMVNETWVSLQVGLLVEMPTNDAHYQFKEAIKEEPDLFLLAGHMPVQK